MVSQCLTCGHKKTDYKNMITGVYVISAWIFAIEVALLILQNKITL